MHNLIFGNLNMPAAREWKYFLRVNDYGCTDPMWKIMALHLSEVFNIKGIYKIQNAS